MFLLSGLSVGVRTKLCVLVSLHALFYRYFQKTDLVPNAGRLYAQDNPEWVASRLHAFLSQDTGAPVISATSAILHTRK